MRSSQSQLPEVLKIGTNELELIVFNMYNSHPNGTVEIIDYGVNVAKVREIIPMPTLTKLPDMPAFANAIADVRGEVILIIDLCKWMKLTPPLDKVISCKVIVLEMLSVSIGMIVHDVKRIRRIKWDQIKPPPSLLQAKHGGKITGVTKIEEQSLLLILDIESIVNDIGAFIPEDTYLSGNIKKYDNKKLNGRVLIVDDSTVARKILRDTLENIGITVIEAVDGKQAMEMLNDVLCKIGDNPIKNYIDLIVTDVEMPEMDGLTFTKNIKNHPKLNCLPVVVNTSLSGQENRQKAIQVGADGYLVKYNVDDIVVEVTRFLS